MTPLGYIMAFDPRFAELFDFTDDELRANRVGQLAPRQKAKLAQEDTQETLDLGCSLFLLLAIAFIALVICGLIFNISTYAQLFLDSLPFAIPIGLLFGGVILYVNYMGNRERRQKYPMPVTALKGEWSLEKIEGRAYDRYYIHIAGLKLKILMMPYDLLRKLDPNIHLTVYIESKSQKIVAVETDEE